MAKMIIDRRSKSASARLALPLYELHPEILMSTQPVMGFLNKEATIALRGTSPVPVDVEKMAS